MGVEDLEPELRDSDVFQVLSARRVAPSERERLMHLVPYPEGIDVKNPLPEWTLLPLSSKIPFVQSPKDYTVYKRGKLGESVRRQGETFDLSDPLNYGLQMKYEPIHDRHLRHYFYSAGNKKILDDMGILTKENQVKCQLHEYNAYRGYVYNVHKNSVMKALKGKESVEADKAEARKFLGEAARLRENQAGHERMVKQALLRSANRKVISICRQLLCEHRIHKVGKVKEKMKKQKEQEQLKLLINQKNFQEQLKNYKIKSQEVNWRRNIRAQNKWKQFIEKEEHRKYFTGEVEKVNKMYEVIENWIKKELFQMEKRERDMTIYSAYKAFSDKRKAARAKTFHRLQLENARKIAEMKENGPVSKEFQEKQSLYQKVGEIYAGLRKLPPNMNTPGYEKPMIQVIMAKALAQGENKSLARKYWGQNIMKSRTTTEIGQCILQCVYMRTVKLYLKYAVFRYLPILITELSHVIALFEEDMRRKKCTVDEIRRFARSYVGQQKGDIFHSLDEFSGYGYVGRLKRKLYHTRNKGVCRCDSESERDPRVVQFSLLPTSAFVDKEKRVSFQINDSQPKTLTLRTKSNISNKIMGKAPTAKTKKKRLFSILKQCPLKKKPESEGDKTNEIPDDVQNICCSALAEGICDCNKEVKRVSFGSLFAKCKTENITAADEVIDTPGMKVTFHPKPTIISIPAENPAGFDFPEFQLPAGGNIKSKILVDFHDQKFDVNETKSIESESELGTTSIFSSVGIKDNPEQKRMNSTGMLKSAMKVNKASPVLELGVLDKIKSAFEPNRENCKRNTSKSHSTFSDNAFRQSWDVFEDIYAKFRKVKDSNSAEGFIHFSSSSASSFSNKDDKFISVDSGKVESKNNYNAFDGRNIKGRKCIKLKRKSRYVLNADSSTLVTDGRKHKHIMNNNTKNWRNGSECNIFYERTKARGGCIQKKNLTAQLDKLILKENNVSLSEISVEIESEISYKNEESQSQINYDNLTSEVTDQANKVGETKASNTQDKPNEEDVAPNKSFESDNSKEHHRDASPIKEEKRGTELRDKLPVEFSNRGKGYHMARENAKYFCLEQVLQPTYEPKYFSDASDENLEDKFKSILMKTSYSAAENCSLVPKLIKQYKLKDIDDLKNFIFHQMSLGEAEALAAVKTEGITVEKASKTCKQIIRDTTNLHTLKKFSKEVIPHGDASFKNLIRINKARTISGEQKKAEDKEELEDEVLNEVAEVTFLAEPVPGKLTNYSRLVTEALPEVNEVYTEFFSRDWPEVFPLNDNKDTGKTTKTVRKNKPKDQFTTKKFKSPEDVIEDSINYKERCLRGEIVFSNETTAKDKQWKQPAITAEKYDLNPKKKQSLCSSDTSEERVQERHSFSFLEARLLEPDEMKLCGVCGVCSLLHHGKIDWREPNVTRLLRCVGCGGCVHDMAASPDSSEPEQLYPVLTVPQPIPTPDESQQEITFCNNHQIRRHYLKKFKRNYKGCANLKAIFGKDFDNNKFVYFVDKDKTYICWKDLLKKRYPLRPFPWNETRLERLKKRKLHLNEIRYCTHPRDILRNKVTEGFGAWESSKTAEYEVGKEEITWNKVPKKYEKLFSTTIAPANKPARTFKPVKDRRPTPFPSLTDLVTSIAEESSNMYEARQKVLELRAESSVVKYKVDSAVRALMDSLANIAVLKLKEGYPSIAKTAPVSPPTRFYYVPTGYHKHLAEKLAKGMGEVLYGLELKEMNFARLQPLADIILRYLVNPQKYPLIFPESALDILDMTDTE